MATGKVTRTDSLQQFLDCLAGQGFATQHDLQTVIVGRVVAAGHHNTGTVIQLVGRKVEYRGGHGPHMDDVASSGHDAPRQRIGQVGAGMPAIVPDAQTVHSPLNSLTADGTADDGDNIRRQGIANNATNVVGPEYGV
jgi:hypothetical protein